MPSQLARVILLASALLLGACGQTAAEPPPGGEPSKEAVDAPESMTAEQAERVRRQELVDYALAPMWDVVEHGDGTGFARSSVDPQALTAEIMWKGNPPDAVQRLAGRPRRASL